jgi:hypothetical protein
MAPQIIVLEHAFHFSLPDIPNETVSRLSKLTFDGGGNVSAKYHLNKFWCKYIKHDISNLKVLSRLFSFTLGVGLNTGLSFFQHITLLIGFNL